MLTSVISATLLSGVDFKQEPQPLVRALGSQVSSETHAFTGYVS
jgi:hypothetical protein